MVPPGTGRSNSDSVYRIVCEQNKATISPTTAFTCQSAKINTTFKNELISVCQHSVSELAAWLLVGWTASVYSQISEWSWIVINFEKWKWKLVMMNWVFLSILPLTVVDRIITCATNRKQTKSPQFGPAWNRLSYQSDNSEITSQSDRVRGSCERLFSIWIRSTAKYCLTCSCVRT